MNAFVRRPLSVLLLPVLLAACGEATAPEGRELGHPSAGAVLDLSSSADLRVLAVYANKPSITIAWAKKWIGPEGGRLDFQGFAIDVPAGAVRSVTQFSIRLPVDPSGSERVVAEFGPHGATFVQPVSIELPLAGTSIASSESPTIVWWNPDVSAWEDMGASVTGSGERLTTATGHFSTFGTTDEERGGAVTVSGG